MKKYMAAAILALPFLASSARADGCGMPCQICLPSVKINIPGCCIPIPKPEVHCSFSCKFNWGCGAPCGGGYGPPSCFGCGGGGAGAGQAGPWYLYWPLEAHFNAPTMPQYPYWPSPMGMAPGAAIGGPAAAGPANFHGGMQQVGYVPPYWYAR